MKLTTAQILDLYLDENGGETGLDDELVKREVDALKEGKDITFESEPPDHSVGIQGGDYVDGDGEFTLEWWDEDYPEILTTHVVERSKPVITKVHYSRKLDESVEEGDEIEYIVNVQLEEVTIKWQVVRVVRGNTTYAAWVWHVTARYSWEAGNG